MYMYRMQPIDFWFGWMREGEYLRRLSKIAKESRLDVNPFLVEYGARRAQAFDLARDCDWEEDIINGPFISAVPDATAHENLILIAWKQGNNGDTFVASPVRLEWLEKDCACWTKGEKQVFWHKAGLKTT